MESNNEEESIAIYQGLIMLKKNGINIAILVGDSLIVI